jgi:hypothetical protein
VGCRARRYSDPRLVPLLHLSTGIPRTSNGAQISHEKHGSIHLRRRDFVHSHSRGRAGRRPTTRQSTVTWTRPTRRRSGTHDNAGSAPSAASTRAARTKPQLDLDDAARHDIPLAHRGGSAASCLRADVLVVIHGVHGCRISAGGREFRVEWIGSQCEPASSRGRRRRCVHASGSEYRATGNDDAKHQQQRHEHDRVYAAIGRRLVVSGSTSTSPTAATTTRFICAVDSRRIGSSFRT